MRTYGMRMVITGATVNGHCKLVGAGMDSALLSSESGASNTR